MVDSRKFYKIFSTRWQQTLTDLSLIYLYYDFNKRPSQSELVFHFQIHSTLMLTINLLIALWTVHCMNAWYTYTCYMSIILRFGKTNQNLFALFISCTKNNPRNFLVHKVLLPQTARNIIYFRSLLDTTNDILQNWAR